MTALVLRPEPGATQTAARLAALGVAAACCPLFAVVPVAWEPPDPAAFDALLLTSANAVRHAGPGLATLAALPVLAVGAATAAAARAAGLDVVLTGDANAATLLADAGAWRRPLHFAGRHRRTVPGVTAVTVYDSAELPIAEETVRGWPGSVALLHSPRAAHRFAALLDAAAIDRRYVAAVALSPAVAAAAGDGWRAMAVASIPTDVALCELVCALIDQGEVAADKRRA